MTPPRPSDLSPVDDPTLDRVVARVQQRLGAAHRRDEWLRYLIGIVLAAVVAYFTSQISTQAQLATQKATEESHFGEVLRRLDALQSDIREIRGSR